MAPDSPTTGFDYPALVRNALVGLIRDLLRGVAEAGLPGDHHFYLTFRTDAPGVVLSAGQRQRFPKEMTIVLQHQYWGLEVGDEAFSVTLHFGGAPERLTVPFAALGAFVDPAASFGLRLDTSHEKAGEAAPDAGARPGAPDAPATATEAAPSPARASTVVPFRLRSAPSQDEDDAP